MQINTALWVGKGLQQISVAVTVDSFVSSLACCMRNSFVDCIAPKTLESATPTVLTSR